MHAQDTLERIHHWHNDKFYLLDAGKFIYSYHINGCAVATYSYGSFEKIKNKKYKIQFDSIPQRLKEPYELFQDSQDLITISIVDFLSDTELLHITLSNRSFDSSWNLVDTSSGFFMSYSENLVHSESVKKIIGINFLL